MISFSEVSPPPVSCDSSPNTLLFQRVHSLIVSRCVLNCVCVYAWRGQGGNGREKREETAPGSTSIMYCNKFSREVLWRGMYVKRRSIEGAN